MGLKVKCFVCGKDLDLDSCADSELYTCSSDCNKILRLLREKLNSNDLIEVLKCLTKYMEPYRAKELLNRYIAYALAVKLKDFDGVLKEVRRRDVYTYEVVFYRIKDMTEVVIPITII